MHGMADAAVPPRKLTDSPLSPKVMLAGKGWQVERKDSGTPHRDIAALAASSAPYAPPSKSFS